MQCCLNKPLGGFSCASCDKKIVNLERCQSTESLAWNQMPFRDRSEKFSRIGAGFKKVLNSVRNDPNTTSYKTRLNKLADISESMSQFQQSRIENSERQPVDN
jgi:hypothetical protein